MPKRVVKKQIQTKPKHKPAAVRMLPTAPETWIELSNEWNDEAQFFSRYLYAPFMIPIIWAICKGCLLPFEWPLALHYGWPVILIFIYFTYHAYINYRFVSKFRRVRVDSQNVYISNFSHEITVPRIKIKEVSSIRWLTKSSVIRIRFKEETAF